jgi:hypothetical protein
VRREDISRRELCRQAGRHRAALRQTSRDSREAPGKRAPTRRDGISRREPFRQTGKTALRFDPDAGRGGPTGSNIAQINERHPGYPGDRVTFDQTAAKRIAARFFWIMTV